MRFMLLGAATGALYALVALGVVLTFRTSRVLNFAAGATGAAAAYAFYHLRDSTHWPWPVLLPLALAVGAGIGAITHFVVMVLLRDTSTLSKAIATLGLMSGIQGLLTLRWPASAGFYQPDTFLPTGRISMGSVVITQDRFVIIGVAIVLSIALRFTYSRTLFGLATSAVAENGRVAAMRGWSPRRIELANFTISGVLSSIAAILLAPIVGLDAPTLTLALLLPALAAALVGRFESFGLAVGAAFLIGIAQAELNRFTAEIQRFLHLEVTGLSSVVPLLIVVIIMVASGASRSRRGDEAARLPLPGGGAVSPVLIVVPTVVVAAMVLLLDASWQTAITTTLLWATMLLSVIVVTGFTGQLSLAQFALGGMGAWAAARTFQAHGLPFPLAFLVGVLVSVAVGLVVALPALRTRGVNLAVVTLALSLMMESLVFNNSSLTGGFSGTNVASPTLFGLDIDPIRHAGRYALVVLGALVLCAIAVANIRRGRAGRRLLAVRSNERAAASLGIGVYGAKFYGFMVGGVLAAVAGILFAFQNNTAIFSQFNVFNSIVAVQFAVVGGIAWVSGAFVGAAPAIGGVFPRVMESLGDITAWLLPISGILAVLTIRMAPEGVAAMNAHSFRWLTRRLPNMRARSAPEPPRRARPPVTVAGRDISVNFGGVTALAEVNFEVRPGEVLGLIGPNGAGKTTLLDIVTGFTRPTAGQVLLDGVDITDWSPERRARAGMGRSFQAVELFEEMSVAENLLVACDRQERSRYLLDVFRPRWVKSTEVMNEVIVELGLEELRDARPRDLPHGKARSVGIARAIVTEPSVLFLDEPGAGLDHVESEELSAVIRRVATERGISVVLVDHDMEMVMQTCDRIVVLDFGKVIAEGSVQDVAGNPLVIEAYLGAPPGDAPETLAVPTMGGSGV